MPKQVTFSYTNHRGVTSERTVDLESVEFIGKPGYGYQPGWFVSGFDHAKQARRSFALSHIKFDENTIWQRQIFTLVRF